MDANSPVTGAGAYWDLIVGSFALALLGVLLLLLAVSRWQRIVGGLAVLALGPGLLAGGWLNNVQVGSGDCLFDGSVNYGTRCGAEFLERYVLTAGILVVALVAVACVLLLAVRERRARRLSEPRPRRGPA